MTSRPLRPIPALRGEERGYFAELRAQRLPYYRCVLCARIFSRPRESCTCSGGAIETLFSAGRGTIYSLTTVHRPGHPWFESSVPYTIALVDFDENFRSLADVTGPAYGPLPYVGQRVHAEFEVISDEVGLAHFVAEVDL